MTIVAPGQPSGPSQEFRAQKVGASISYPLEPFSPEDIQAYQRRSFDYNSLHSDPEFVRDLCRRKELPAPPASDSCVVPGSILMERISGLLHKDLGDGILNLYPNEKFRGFIYTGQPVKVEVVIKAVRPPKKGSIDTDMTITLAVKIYSNGVLAMEANSLIQMPPASYDKTSDSTGIPGAEKLLEDQGTGFPQA